MLNPKHSASSSILFSSNNNALNRIFKILFKYKLFYNILLFSAIQESDSVIHINYFLYYFPLCLSHDIEYSPLCYTVGLCCLSISVYTPNIGTPKYIKQILMERKRIIIHILQIKKIFLRIDLRM